MFTAAIMLAALEAASGGTRRPTSVALTWEGAGAGMEVVDFLRFRLHETFEIDAANLPAEHAGDGDFHVHVVALPNDVFSVRVDEAGTTIASRELIAPNDPGTELWFFMKTTLRRALYGASAAPGGPHIAPPVQETRLAAPADFSLAERSSSSSEVAIRATGGVTFGASALEKAGMIGADYRFDLAGTSVFAGAEVGYLASNPNSGSIGVRRIPISLTAGLRVFDDLQVVLGAFAGVDHVRASSPIVQDSAWVASFGPLLRGRAELFDRFSLVLDLRGRFTVPRVRYLLPDRLTSVLESAVSISATSGVEWRWH